MTLHELCLLAARCEEMSDANVQLRVIVDRRGLFLEAQTSDERALRKVFLEGEVDQLSDGALSILIHQVEQMRDQL